MAFHLNRKGQGLIESLALSAALMAFISTLAAVLYFSVVHAGMNYLMHENLVCEQTQGSKNCAQDLKNKARAWLVFARLRSFNSSKSLGNVRAQMQIDMPFRRTLTLKKEMALL